MAASGRALALLTLLAAIMTRAFADKPMDPTGDQSGARRGDRQSHLVCTQYLSPAAARATERQPRDAALAETGLAAHVPPHLRHLASNFGVAQTPIGAPVDFSVLCSCNAVQNWTYAQVMWQADPSVVTMDGECKLALLGKALSFTSKQWEHPTAVFWASVPPRLCDVLQLAPGVRMLEFEGERMAVIVGLVRDLRGLQHSTSKKTGKVYLQVSNAYQRAAAGHTSLRCFTDPHAAAGYCLQLACQQAGGPGQLTPAQHLQERAADYDCENQTVLALLAAGLPLSFSPHLDRTRGWDAAVLDDSGADLGAAMRGGVLGLDGSGRPVISMHSYGSKGSITDVKTTLWLLGREPDDDEPGGGGSRLLGLPTDIASDLTEGKHARFHPHGVTPVGALSPRTGPDWWQIVSSCSPGPQQLPSLLLDPTDPGDLRRLKQLVLAGNDPQKYWPLLQGTALFQRQVDGQRLGGRPWTQRSFDALCRMRAAVARCVPGAGLVPPDPDSFTLFGFGAPVPKAPWVQWGKRKRRAEEQQAADAPQVADEAMPDFDDWDTGDGGWYDEVDVEAVPLASDGPGEGGVKSPIEQALACLEKVVPGVTSAPPPAPPGYTLADAVAKLERVGEGHPLAAVFAKLEKVVPGVTSAPPAAPPAYTLAEAVAKLERVAHL